MGSVRGALRKRKGNVKKAKEWPWNILKGRGGRVFFSYSPSPNERKATPGGARFAPPGTSLKIPPKKTMGFTLSYRVPEARLVFLRISQVRRLGKDPLETPPRASFSYEPGRTWARDIFHNP